MDIYKKSVLYIAGDQCILLVYLTEIFRFGTSLFSITSNHSSTKKTCMNRKQENSFKIPIRLLCINSQDAEAILTEDIIFQK